MTGIEQELEQARRLLTEHQYAEAETLCRGLLERWPDKPMVRRLLARASLGLGKEEQATEVLGNIYSQAVDLAIQRLSTPETKGGPQLAPWLLKLVIQREFKVLTGEESRQFLAKHLPPEKLPIASGKDWFFQLKNGSRQLAGPVVPDMTLRMLDACLMLEDGRPRVFNPLTGELSQRVRSILPDLVLLRDADKSVWVSCVPKFFSSATLESVYLLPGERVIIDTRGSDSATTLSLLLPDLLHYLGRRDDFHQLLARDPDSNGITVADRPLAHLGHYVWNGISTWSTLLKSDLFSKAHTLASWSTADYFGDLFEMFPEFSQAGVDTLRVGEIKEAVDHIARTGNFWLPMYERFVREDLCHRIRESCAGRSSTGFIENLQSVPAEGSPLVLLTLRLGNRVWLEQEAGFVNIIKSLSEQFPGVGFILDGMTTTDVSGESTHDYMDVSGEMALAQRIISELDPDARVINLVGTALKDSIVACGEIDAFIAPWGTGMTKYKWIANKPGIAFGNRLPDDAVHAGIGIRVFDGFRENIIKAVDIPAEHISDAGEGNLDHPLRRNFHLPWQVLAEAATAQLRSLGFQIT